MFKQVVIALVVIACIVTMASARISCSIKNSVLYSKISSHLKCHWQYSIRVYSHSSARGNNPYGFGGSSKSTVSDVLNMWNQKFRKCCISEPRESAEYIVGHVLGTSKVCDIYRRQEDVLLPADIEQINNLCEKRLQRMPVQYIIEEWDFRDLTLKMSRPVFIPRPETEILIDIVLNEIDFKGTDEVLELCCGSGAISLALLKSRPQLQAIAIDKSEHACKLSKENGKINGLSSRLQIIQSDIMKNFQLDLKTFDIIVSNPPYVPSKDMDFLQPEITLYEDLEALDGGEDGLTVIKSIFRICSSLLNYGGKLFLEVDPSHPAIIKSWLQKHDCLRLIFSRSFRDFSDKERFVEIIKEK